MLVSDLIDLPEPPDPQRLNRLQELTDELVLLTQQTYRDPENTSQNISAQVSVICAYGMFISTYNGCRSEKDQKLVLDTGQRKLTGLRQNFRDDLSGILVERMILPINAYQVAIHDPRYALLDFVLRDGTEDVEQKLDRIPADRRADFTNMLTSASALCLGLEGLVCGEPLEDMTDPLQRNLALSVGLLLDMADEARALKLKPAQLINFMTARINPNSPNYIPLG
jgi:hypothetical protein